MATNGNSSSAGTVVFVTGAASGMGRVAALASVREGMLPVATRLIGIKPHYAD